MCCRIDVCHLCLERQPAGPAPFLSRLPVLHGSRWHLCYIPGHICVYFISVSRPIRLNNVTNVQTWTNAIYFCYKLHISDNFLICHYLSILSIFHFSMWIAESTYQVPELNLCFTLYTTDKFRMLSFLILNMKVDLSLVGFSLEIYTLYQSYTF